MNLRTHTPMRAQPLTLLLVGLLFACSAPPSQSTAQTPRQAPIQGGLDLPQAGREAPASAGQLKLSFAPVVKRAAPAVVNISSKRVVRQQVDPF